MDLSRFLDLYIAETQEHLRALNRSLLELESGGGSASVEEAFRAAHTIKGMSATMGYRAVTEIAHGLEDRLDGVRAGRVEPTAALIDDLLASADALEHAVAAAVVTQTAVDGGEGALDLEGLVPLDGTEAHGVDSAPAPRAKAVDIIAPAGTEIVIRICVRADTQLVGARALIARRNAERVALILAAAPDDFGEGFDGEFRLFVGAGGDRTELEKVIRAAGDIETVEFEAPISAPASPAADATRNRARHVRVDQRRIDDLADGIGELSILRARLADVLKNGRADVAKNGRADALHDLVERMRRLVDEVQNVALAMRMVPVGEVFDRFPRMVRDAARSLGKDVDFRVEGREIELDRSVLDEIADPLVHLLRNSLDHGIESPAVRATLGKTPRALVVLRAESGRASVRVSVRDDGGGINRARVREKGIAMGLLPSDARALLSEEELLRVMGSPGFSTADQITDVSGRGVGLDAVMNKVRSLGGVIELKTAESEGTTFTLVLPITLAVAHSLRVRVGGEQYAIPLTHVSEVVEIHRTVQGDDGRELLLVREERIPLVRLRALLSPGSSNTEAAAVISEIGERRTALAVDELVTKEQIYVKSFDPAAGTLPIFSGVTLLADGRPILVLDPISVS